MCAVVPSNQQMFCVPRALNHPWKKVWQLSFQFVSQMKEKMVGKKKDYSGKIFFFCHKHRGEKLFQSHFNIFFFFLTHLPLRASVLYFKNIQEFFLFVLWKIFFSLCLLFSIARVNNWGFIKFLRLFFFLLLKYRLVNRFRQRHKETQTDIDYGFKCIEKQSIVLYHWLLVFPVKYRD